MTWQQQLGDELIGRLPPSADVRVVGSSSDPAELDGWSDLDLHVRFDGNREAFDLLAGYDVWAVSEDLSTGHQVLRVVLRDGRRLDLVVEGGAVVCPPRADDNDVRVVAALAAVKLGRGDHLIGLHLTLELLRTCLVSAMLLRDRELGTDAHRFGSARDASAAEIAALLDDPLGVTPRPNVVERAVALYAGWQRELDPAYVADWSGLDAILARGIAGA